MIEPILLLCFGLKAVGPPPLPGRWPSTPNGQSLASELAPVELSRCRRKLIGWNLSLTGGASFLSVSYPFAGPSPPKRSVEEATRNSTTQS